MAGNAVRRVELITALSLAIDIGLGVPMETMLRSGLVAARLAAAAGVAPDVASAAYHLALLRFVGCTSTSLADSFVFGGDELAVSELAVAGDEEMVSAVERTVGAGLGPAARTQAVNRFFGAFASGEMRVHHQMHCEAAAIISDRLDLGPLVRAGFADLYERWDGRGSVRQAQGEEISQPMRIAQVAFLAGYHGRNKTPAEISAMVVARAGRQLDPALARTFAATAGTLMAGADGADLTSLALTAEPAGPAMLEGRDIDRGLAAIADFGDFKSPHMLGHSRRVADMAAAAARAASMPAADVQLVHRAGLVHDVGRVGVQAQLLSKTGTLSAAEHERIRLHTYLTERLFAASDALAPVGAVGAMHHERLDASGYHRGLAAPMLPATARLLAAANTWCALTEPRPHRPRMTDTEAAAELGARARGGTLDSKAVDAVLTSAGQKPRQARRAAGIGLSEREIEVLRMVSRQQTNKEIAHALDISPKTVERHVTHIYDKVGVTTRAGAALYALENGLL